MTTTNTKAVYMATVLSRAMQLCDVLCMHAYPVAPAAVNAGYSVQSERHVPSGLTYVLALQRMHVLPCSLHTQLWSDNRWVTSRYGWLSRWQQLCKLLLSHTLRCLSSFDQYIPGVPWLTCGNSSCRSRYTAPRALCHQRPCLFYT